MPFYAVKVGLKTGIYETWPECKRMVNGVPNAKFKKFNARIEADQFIRGSVINFAQNPGLNNNQSANVMNNAGGTMIPNFGKGFAYATCLQPVQIQTEVKNEVISLLSDDEGESKPKIASLGQSPAKFDNIQPVHDIRPFNGPQSTSSANKVPQLADERQRLQSAIEAAVKDVVGRSNLSRYILQSVAVNVAGGDVRVDVNVNFFSSDCSRKTDIYNPQIEAVPVAPKTRKRKATTAVARSDIKRATLQGIHQNATRSPWKNNGIRAPNNFLAATTEGERVVVYTDGACDKNGRTGALGGIGVYWGPGNPLNVSERLIGRQTNNRAEIMAAVRALQQVHQMGKTKVTLYTDSQFMINGITNWIHTWKRNGWVLSTGGDVINRIDFEALESASHGLDVEWVYCPGHRGVPGNEAADKLAKGATYR